MNNSDPEPKSEPMDDSNNDSMDNYNSDDDLDGGRRRKSRKGGKTRKVNSALKSWVAFVKKISKEEKISYPKAMKRASTRKSEWKRGGHGEFHIEKSLTQSKSQSKSKSKSQAGGEKLTPSEIANQNGSSNVVGGARRTKRSSKKRRGSRRR
jgi:hypothetical protein